MIDKRDSISVVCPGDVFRCRTEGKISLGMLALPGASGVWGTSSTGAGQDCVEGGERGGVQGARREFW